MRRRTFIAALGSAAAWPVVARAQQPRKVSRVGILLFNSPQTDPIGPLLQGLQGLGYVDGKTIKIDYRFAEGKGERLPDLAVELVQLKPDVIFAYGGDVAPYAKKATGSIPIVAMVSNDPVQSGLVASIGRPGANVTGITLIYDDLAGKVLELLKEACRESRVLRFCGTRTMPIRNFGRRSVWPLLSVCRFNLLRFGGLAISMERSTPR